MCGVRTDQQPSKLWGVGSMPWRLDSMPWRLVYMLWCLVLLADGHGCRTGHVVGQLGDIRGKARSDWLSDV